MKIGLCYVMATLAHYNDDSHANTMAIATTPPTTPTATAWTGTDESLPSLTMVSAADNTT